MRIQMKTTKNSIAILSLCLLVWLLFAFYLYYRVESDANRPAVEKIEPGKMAENIMVEVNDSKFWYNDVGQQTQSVGAQYDGVVTNTGDVDISKWEMIISLPEEGIIDSFWNGEFQLEEGQIRIIPDENTALIPAGQSKTFGFIMISRDIIDFESFQLIICRQVRYIDYPLFWILIVTAVAWIAMAIAVVIVDFKVRYFREQKIKDANIISQTMKTFAEMIDAKDPYTRGHSVRVAYYAREIGRRLRMNEEECIQLGYIALMHDCGKVGVPDHVLTKPGKLDPEERKMIEEHTVIGGKMLSSYTAIEGIKDGALYHHERFDGNGYPQGIKGKEIPLLGRIIGVADAYDAMNSDRCYRSHLSKEEILDELHKHTGTQFDPDIVKHMIDMIQDGFCDNKEIPIRCGRVFP